LNLFPAPPLQSLISGPDYSDDESIHPEQAKKVSKEPLDVEKVVKLTMSLK